MRAGNAPHEEDNLFYPGTCRRLTRARKNRKVRKGE